MGNKVLGYSKVIIEPVAEITVLGYNSTHIEPD